MSEGGAESQSEPSAPRPKRRTSRALFSATLAVVSLILLKVAEEWGVGHEMHDPVVYLCFALGGLSAIASIVSVAFGVAALRPGQRQRWWLLITAIILFGYLWPQLYSDFNGLVLGR